MAASEPAAQAGMISLSQVARLLMISERRVQQLAAEGYIPKPSRGSYSLVGAVQGYIRFRDEAERRKTQSAAESGLKATRQAEIELRMAERQRDLVPAEEMMAVTQMIVGTLVSRLSGLPAQFTRNMDERRRLEAAIDAIRVEVARLIEEHSESYDGLRGPDPSDQEDTA